MTITQEQRDLITSIQSLALSVSDQPRVRATAEISSGAAIVWSRVIVIIDGEVSHHSTVGIDANGEFDCLGHMTLERQRDALAALIVEHRKQEAA